MRRRPGVWLVAHDRSRCGKMPPYTIYTVKIRRRYDGRWYHNYNTSRFALALECWKKECASKWPKSRAVRHCVNCRRHLQHFGGTEPMKERQPAERGNCERCGAFGVVFVMVDASKKIKSVDGITCQ